VTGTIPVTADGDDIWIGVNGAVIHVDGRTNAQTRISVPSMQSSNGALLKAPDGLWVADYRGGKLRRVDPATGTIELEIDVKAPLGLVLVDHQVWVISGVTHGTYHVDGATGQLGPQIGDNFRTIVTASAGLAWEGRPGSQADSDEAVSLDMTTGAIVSTITVPQGTGCDVNGTVPTNIWAGCTIFELSDPAPRPIVRIDPGTSSVAATVTLANFVGMVVVDGVPWFITYASGDGGSGRTTLVAADPRTGRVIALLDLGELGPDDPVTTSSALWIPDEGGKRVVKYSLADLKP
jgi:hypothetical protein